MSDTGSGAPALTLKTATSQEADVAQIQTMAAKLDQLRAQVSRKIVGQEEVVELLLLTLFARGHALLIGVPGLAKTLLIQTLSEAMDLSFSRIQVTPDLMPSDITGTEILNEDPETKNRTFQFVKGPVFANVLLADEGTEPRLKLSCFYRPCKNAKSLPREKHWTARPVRSLRHSKPHRARGHLRVARGAVGSFHVHDQRGVSLFG